MAATDTTNPAYARIYGSDYDSVYLAPLGTTLPTTIDETLDSAFEAVGWLSDDGVTEAPTGEKKDLRGFQGNRVVRSLMDSPGTEYSFVALEDKEQTKSLRYDDRDVTVSNGVRKATRGPGQKVSSRAVVVDRYDADNVTVHERLVYEQWDIAPDGDRTFVSTDIAGYPMKATVISDATVLSSEGASGGKTSWALKVTGSPTSGTYVLRLNGVPTSDIQYDADKDAVAAALNALSGVTGVSGITAAGTSTITITLPDNGTVAVSNVDLTGGTSPNVTVS